MKCILGFLFRCFLVFLATEINGVWNFISNLGYIILWIINLTNLISIKITGDGVLTHIFLHPIVWGLVGFLFIVWDIEKGFFGKIFGKAIYRIIKVPVSSILNYFSSLFFH